MTKNKALSRAFRLTYYNLYRTPSLGEFSKEGFLYERPNVIFRKPNGEITIFYVEETVGKNGEDHYYANRKEELKKALQKNYIKVKKYFKTDYLYRLLHYDNLPLMFKIRGLKVVVYPKKDNQCYEHDVYVEGIHQRLLSQFDMIQKPIYDKWFTKNKINDPINQDWRYLLRLDSRNPIADVPNDNIGKCFLGIYANSLKDKEEKQKKIRNRHGNIPAKNTKVIHETKLYVLLTNGTKIAV